MADTIVEGAELFTVSVISTNFPLGILAIEPDTQTAIIADNSSKFNSL